MRRETIRAWAASSSCPRLTSTAQARSPSAGQLTFDGSPFTIRDSNYHLLLAHLESPRYQEILANLR